MLGYTDGGGDEFVVAMSGDIPIDTEIICQRIRSVAGPVPMSTEISVDLELRVGVTSTGPSDDGDGRFASLLSLADLSTYDDKAHHERPPQPIARRSTDTHYSDR